MILTIPVVGGFEPQALAALAIAPTFSIITTADHLVALDRVHARTFGIAENLRSILSIDLKVSELQNRDLVHDLVVDQSQHAVQHDGADAILLGCTAFLDVAERVSKSLINLGLNVPVMDPNRTGVCFLEMLVRCGLSQSRNAYAQIPPKPADTKRPTRSRSG